MSGKSRDRLAPVLTEASSWTSDRSARALPMRVPRETGDRKPCGSNPAAPTISQARSPSATTSKGFHIMETRVIDRKKCSNGTVCTDCLSESTKRLGSRDERRLGPGGRQGDSEREYATSPPFPA